MLEWRYQEPTLSFCERQIAFEFYDIPGMVPYSFVFESHVFCSQGGWKAHTVINLHSIRGQLRIDLGLLPVKFNIESGMILSEFVVMESRGL